MTNFKSKSIFSRFKMNIASKCAECKGRIWLISIIVLLCFVAGIILFSSNPYSYPGDEYLLSYKGAGDGFGAFFSRSFSITIVTGLIFVLSLSKWVFPLGIAVIGFRGYLLGFNISILCSRFGLSGVIDAVFIVIPCQLCMLLGFILLYALLTKSRSLCFGFGRGNLFKTLLMFYLIIIFINLIETILLFVFSSSVILVI